MSNIKIISFDVEGTLVTTEFSYAIWFESIPERYAEKYGIPPEEAKKRVFEEYQNIGDQKLEWYDIRYWFKTLDLGDPKPVMAKCASRVHYFSEVKDLLSSLSKKYKLVVASGSPREFLDYLLRDIDRYFKKTFSSISDYKQLKTPDFYIQMCRDLNIEAKQMIHIGDNLQFDFANPVQAGIQSFHLDRNGNKPNQNSLTSLIELKIYL